VPWWLLLRLLAGLACRGTAFAKRLFISFELIEWSFIPGRLSGERLFGESWRLLRKLSSRLIKRLPLPCVRAAFRPKPLRPLRGTLALCGKRLPSGKVSAITGGAVAEGRLPARELLSTAKGFSRREGSLRVRTATGTLFSSTALFAEVSP
jgi:hypothetical protein